MATDAQKRYTPTLKTKVCQLIAERLNFEKSMMTNEILFEQFYAVQEEIVPAEYHCGPAAWADNREWVMTGVKKAKPEKTAPGKPDPAFVKRLDAVEEMVTRLATVIQSSASAEKIDRVTLDEVLHKVDALVERVNRFSTIRELYEKQCHTVTSIEAINQRQAIALEEQAQELDRFKGITAELRKFVETQRETIDSLKATVDHLMEELGVAPGAAGDEPPPATTPDEGAPRKLPPESDSPRREEKPATAKAEAPKFDVVIVGLHANVIRSVRESHGEKMNLTFIDNSTSARRAGEAAAGKPAIVVFGGCSGGVQDAVKKTASPYIHLSHGSGASTVKRALDTLFVQLTEEMAAAPVAKKKSS